MKITLHRALSRVKTTEARLNNMISALSRVSNKEGNILVDIYSNKNKTCLTTVKPEEDTKKAIQGTWDKFNSLYDELVNLKKAITLSNSGVAARTDLNTVKVCGKDYTIAELIVLQKVIQYKKNWLTSLKSHYAYVTNIFNNKQEDVNYALNELLKSRLSADGKNVDKSIMDSLAKPYLEMNGYVLVDPLNVAEKIAELEKEVDAFTVESDAAFSEANALRTIEVALAD